MNRREYSNSIKSMLAGQYTLSELKLTSKDIITIRNLEHNIKSHYDPRKKDYVYYITPKDDMAYMIISEKTAAIFRICLKLIMRFGLKAIQPIQITMTKKCSTR